MAIVSYDYYYEIYMGEAVAEKDFPPMAKKAERLIKQITHGRATEEKFAALPAFQQEAVIDAICAQIEYYALYGVDVSIGGRTADGFTVGKVRVDAGKQGTATGAASMVCPSAIAALEQTGLLNPQVQTVGEPPRLPWPWGCF